LSLALQRTGGKLTTFEIDPGRAATARDYFLKAGAAQQVDVVVGDAHQRLPGVRDPIDMVFLDAEKEGYIDYCSKLLPLVRRGGLILAHNVDRSPDYVRFVPFQLFSAQGNAPLPRSLSQVTFPPCRS
jgi:predicted O-methyltransferase YrrM